MANRDELYDSLCSFADAYNQHDQLRVMNKDWSRKVLVRATDIGVTLGLALDGTLQALEEAPEQADMELAAESELLTEIFYGELSPTEPYMDGRLTIRGSEDDMIRLDFITAMLWED